MFGDFKPGDKVRFNCGLYERFVSSGQEHVARMDEDGIHEVLDYDGCDLRIKGHEKYVFPENLFVLLCRICGEKDAFGEGFGECEECIRKERDRLLKDFEATLSPEQKTKQEEYTRADNRLIRFEFCKCHNF